MEKDQTQLLSKAVKTVEESMADNILETIENEGELQQAASITPTKALHMCLIQKPNKFTGALEVKSISDWSMASQIIANTMDLFIYGHNGVYVYRDDMGKYRVLDGSPTGTIRRHIVDMIPNLKPGLTAQLSEATIDRLRIVKPILDPSVIYFANGQYDTVSGTFLHDPNPEYNHRRLPVDYKTRKELLMGYSGAITLVENFMNLISDGDKDIQKQILEMIGASALPTGQFRKAFFLLGDGGNGKSSLLNIIRKVHGDEKISSITLENLSGQRSQFVCFGLVNKTANIIDDMSKISMKENGTFKSLVAGEGINVEIKQGKQFTYDNEATIIAGGNAIPNLNDKGSSTAITDRLVIVPLNHVFAKTPKGRRVAQRLLGSDTVTVFASLAAHAAHSASTKGLTLGVRTLQANRTFEIENDSVLYWLEEERYFDDVTHGVPVVKKMVYQLYQSFTIAAGAKPVGIQNFGKSIMKHLPNIEAARVRIDGQRVPVYRGKLEVFDNIDAGVEANNDK